MEDNAPAKETATEQLAYDTFNPDRTETILFIHGAFGSAVDWDLVTPHLKEQHLLLPDLPSHGRSHKIKPFSLDYAADLLADLIKRIAHDQKTYVIGHSLGASVAIRLATRYPNLVHLVLVSGVCKLPRSWSTPYLPRAVWLNARVEYAIPRAGTRWLVDGTDLKRPNLSRVDMELAREIFADSLSSDADQWPCSWPAKTLIVAATKRGTVPSNDSVEVAKKMAEIGRESNPDTLAIEHPLMRHPWTRQDPALFAELVKAWLEDKPFSADFKTL
ncbi:uncharacterized protein MYCFIDRAFT_152983 [Pseudocercospora fijiensis CIRAD86]|uniref:AB hydrolase-1 domain-containing protein n=1 Tax=Pseudocercospora fijiensis (strain CIRAD86) TaxID=383855 RepID=M3A0X9_PSEFD|nr:uncharacterized protein MYCFIDRAFT_152983 [Pseudocercospora fijiensis CIRAD86]EME84794.1 hypothetical protein MYCFIDRAFT_152983 [Pseudocercospora fijiensis CIRAD86]